MGLLTLKQYITFVPEMSSLFYGGVYLTETLPTLRYLERTCIGCRGSMAGSLLVLR